MRCSSFVSLSHLAGGDTGRELAEHPSKNDVIKKDHRKIESLLADDTCVGTFNDENSNNYRTALNRVQTWMVKKVDTEY